MHDIKIYFKYTHFLESMSYSCNICSKISMEFNSAINVLGLALQKENDWNDHCILTFFFYSNKTIYSFTVQADLNKINESSGFKSCKYIANLKLDIFWVSDPTNK